ncbi:hypothetical protein QUA56_31915 [Microcoleus sp. N3A4]
MVILGGAAEHPSPTSNLEQLPPGHIANSQPMTMKKQRRLSCFVLGLLTLMADLLKNRTIHLERWSSFPDTPVDEFYACNSS